MHFDMIMIVTIIIIINPPPDKAQQNQWSVRSLWDGPSRQIRAFVIVKEDNLKTMPGRFISCGGARLNHLRRL